jgi:hypothetical protein
MGNEASEQMMALLQELAMLKDLAKQHEENPSAHTQGEQRQRQRRQDEIAQEIKALGEQEKGEQQKEASSK